MIKLIGAAIIIVISLLAGYIYTDSQRKRIADISALRKLVEHIGANIQMFKTPLDEIYSRFKCAHLHECNFFDSINRGIYFAADKSGLLHGEEEREIISLFDEKIGTGSAEDSVSLCAFTAEKMRSLEEKLSSDLPERLKTFRTIFLLAGISIIIVFI